MLSDSQIKKALYLHVGVIVAFVVGRLWGGDLFHNSWSFIHWQHQPVWYSILWLGLLVALTPVLAMYLDRIVRLLTTRLAIVIAAAVLLLLLILFQFDSIVYGGGNLRVAQISQAPKIILRWFEYGIVMLVSWVYYAFSFFDWHDVAATSGNIAGTYAWKTFAFICSLASLVGSIKLARELTGDSARRFLMFVILFFGPQSLLYFGFVGVEPVVVAITIWFSLLVVRLNREFSTNRLLALTLVVMAGGFLHFWLFYLIPATVFVALRQTFRQGYKRAHLPLAAGLLTYVVLLVLVYLRGLHDFEFSQYLLFLSGKSPFGDYALFSARHIGDILQVFFLAFPALVVVKYLFFGKLRTLPDDDNIVTAGLMVLAGNTVLVILNPVHGIILDLPRLVAYLTPLAFLLALLTRDVKTDNPNGRRLLAFLAATSLLVPLSYLPVYLKINHADTYAAEYFDKHEFYYRDGCLAFRDAYFYKHVASGRDDELPLDLEQIKYGDFDSADPTKSDLEKANAWEWKLPTKAPDYLNFRGADDLISAGRLQEALELLNHMKAQNPYRSDVRTLLSSLLIRMERFDVARIAIDSALMLDPYRNENLRNDYICYRDTRDYYRAIKAATRAAEYFPGDDLITSDIMIIHHRSGNRQAAESMARSLLEADSSLPYPYLILGFTAEARGSDELAIMRYEKFVSLAPEYAETPQIRKRLNDLVLKRMEK